MCAGLPGRRSFGPGLIFLLFLFFVSRQRKESYYGFSSKSEETDSTYKRKVYILSFACAKESNKEKHTGNDIQPLPGAVIKLQCYC
jgi:hypothetical protein